MRLSDAIEGYLLFKSQRAAATTIETDTVLLQQFTGWFGNDPEVDEVTTEQVLAYLQYHTNRGLSPYTVTRHRAILSALWSWLGKHEVVPSNVVTDTQSPRLPKRKQHILSNEEVSALIDAAKQSQCPKRDEALIRFMLDGCARATEVARLQRADIDLKNGRCRVVGKGNKERFITVGSRALHAVWLYLTTDRPTCSVVRINPVFLSPDGYPMNRDSLRLCIYRLGKRAEIPRVHPHLLRHTGAVLHLLNGMNLESLRAFLGHEDLDTTRQYLTGLTDEDLEHMAKRTSPGDNWRL
jgi:integrase/recombinase XerD